MIIIDVEGGRKAQKAFVKDAGLFYIKRLMPRIKNLAITVKLIRGLTDKDGVCGDCIWEDRNHKPREFTIRIDSKENKEFILDTLAHEMIHVKQYARGELVDLVRKPKMSRFKGKLIPWESKDEPWEKEQWEKSKALYEDYKSYK
jgi:hypothetical protein